ncbi:hypothetical protein D3C81_1836720 [compost metagenome]
MEAIPEVLEEIRPYNSSVKAFEDKIKRFLPFAEQMERDICSEQGYSKFPIWHVQGVIRTIMDTTCEKYWKIREAEGFPEEVFAVKRKYAKLVKRS